MPKPPGQACANCRYFTFEVAPSSRDGWCVRYPPQTGGSAGTTAWPTVTKDWWCGEWKTDAAESVDVITA